MNNVHDMGGMMGFGPITPEIDEPVFHASWERRVLAMTIAMGLIGGWSIDKSRFSRESIPPQDYLSMTYYEIWYTGLVSLLLEYGLISKKELVAGTALEPGKPVARTLQPAEISPIIAKGRPVQRKIDTSARFRTGDLVRARNIHPTGHTRLPRYVRGRLGEVTYIHGAHIFPDSNASGLGEVPQWLYTVRFSGTELWGETADPSVTISVDAWESYLEPPA